jgi:hypothetical protein
VYQQQATENRSTESLKKECRELRLHNQTLAHQSERAVRARELGDINCERFALEIAEVHTAKRAVEEVREALKRENQEHVRAQGASRAEQERSRQALKLMQLSVNDAQNRAREADVLAKKMQGEKEEATKASKARSAAAGDRALATFKAAELAARSGREKAQNEALSQRDANIEQQAAELTEVQGELRKIQRELKTVQEAHTTCIPAYLAEAAQKKLLDVEALWQDMEDARQGHLSQIAALQEQNVELKFSALVLKKELHEATFSAGEVKIFHEDLHSYRT